MFVKIMNCGLRTASIMRNRLHEPIFLRNLMTSRIDFASPPARHPSESAKMKNVNSSIDNPIEYFGSKASSWNAKDSRSGGADEMLWYQPYVVVGSMAIFLIYFCILREENDIDRKLEGNLFDHISGLEEAQLIISYRYNRDNGLDVKDIEQRLGELGIDVKSLN